MRRFAMMTSIVVTVFVAGRLSRQLPVNAAEGRGQKEVTTSCGDLNTDGAVDVSDAVYLLFCLFLDGPCPECPMSAPTEGGVPATGETRCYDIDGNEVSCDSGTCRGQDGFYQSGCPTRGRFVDNGDGTVTDTCTGLMWQQDTSDIDGDGQIGNADRVNWCEALAYCEDLDLADYDDWRLPNIRELLSVVDYGRMATPPVIDPVFEAESSRYWASTTVAGLAENPVPDIAWFVYFGAGGALANEKGSSYFVRSVRGP